MKIFFFKYVDFTSAHGIKQRLDSQIKTLTYSDVEEQPDDGEPNGYQKFWCKFRAGCITVSRMKAVCHTKAAKPLQSLINTLTTVCYTLNISKQT